MIAARVVFVEIAGVVRPGNSRITEVQGRMLVGVMTTQLALAGVSSLKQKRSIVKSVIGRLKSRFNVSISEVDRQDSKVMAVVAMAIVSNDSRFIDQQFDSILNFMRNDGRFYLSSTDREIFS